MTMPPSFTHLLSDPSVQAHRLRARVRAAVFPETGHVLRPDNPFDKALDDRAALQKFLAIATPEEAARVLDRALAA